MMRQNMNHSYAAGYYIKLSSKILNYTKLDLNH
jgi:hypothetical protein